MSANYITVSAKNAIFQNFG